MNNTLILIAADAPQSGKSTVAALLSQFLKSQSRVVIRHAFADPIKKMLATLLTGQLKYNSYEAFEALYGEDKESPVRHLKVSNVTHRKLMQTLGTEWREISGCPNLGGEIMLSKLESLHPTGVFVIVDDYRFPLEKDFLEAHLTGWDIKVIQVVRPTTKVEGHRSEGGLTGQGFDYTIYNTEGLNELAKVVDLVGCSLLREED